MTHKLGRATFVRARLNINTISQFSEADLGKLKGLVVATMPSDWQAIAEALLFKAAQSGNSGRDLVVHLILIDEHAAAEVRVTAGDAQTVERRVGGGARRVAPEPEHTDAYLRIASAVLNGGATPGVAQRRVGRDIERGARHGGRARADDDIDQRDSQVRLGSRRMQRSANASSAPLKEHVVDRELQARR